MNDSQYLTCVIALSGLGVLFSWINSRIVLCPRNRRQGWIFEIGFVVVLMVSLSVMVFDIHFKYVRLSMLLFLAICVIFVIWLTLDHYFHHIVRRSRLCRYTAYKRNLGNVLEDGRLDKSITGVT